MTTYDWTIAQLDYQRDTGAVLTAHWRVNASTGEHTVSAYGAVNFTPEPHDPSFVALNDLTEAKVLEWVWKAEVDKAAVEAALGKQLEDLKNPPVVAGVPWTA